MKLSDKRKKFLKTIGMSLLISACLNGAFAVMDLKPSVDEFNKVKASAVHFVLGGGGLWSLARTFQAGGVGPLAVYGGGVIGYYLLNQAYPTWFPL